MAVNTKRTARRRRRWAGGAALVAVLLTTTVGVVNENALEGNADRATNAAIEVERLSNELNRLVVITSSGESLAWTPALAAEAPGTEAEAQGLLDVLGHDDGMATDVAPVLRQAQSRLTGFDREVALLASGNVDQARLASAASGDSAGSQLDGLFDPLVAGLKAKAAHAADESRDGLLATLPMVVIIVGVVLAWWARRRRSLEVQGRAWYENLVEKGSSLVVVSDASNDPFYASATAARFLGVEHLTKAAVLASLHPEDGAALQEALVSVSASSTAGPLDLRFSDTEGQWHTFETVATDLSDLPEVGGVVWNLHDVTDRRSLEVAAEIASRQLADSEEQLSLALLAAQMGTWEANSATGAITWSERTEQLHGLAPGTFAGTIDAWLACIHPDDRSRVRATLDEVGDGPDSSPLTYRVALADGSTRYLSGARHVDITGGGHVRFVGVAFDITEQRLGELAMLEAKEEAERANGEKSRFLSRVSHELRTPLNAILGFGQLLDMDDLPDQQQESVDQVLSAGRHLLALIDDVLDISRIDSGELSLSIEPVSMSELMDETIALIRPMAASRGVTIENVVGSDAWVSADRRRLKQILLNLASNAVKYNRDGGRIRFACGPAGPSRVAVSVTDTGIGITAEQLSRLFVPFDRLGAERTATEGTGIGLALSRRLAEAMDATLSVESHFGAGSTFSVEIARAEPPVGLDRLADPHDASQPPPGRPPPGRPLRGRVLYVEDNPANGTLMERLVERTPGIELITATTGADGLRIARSSDIDLILLDLHLPDINGDDVLRQLRNAPRTSATPVIMVSADATDGQIKRLRAAGADDYLTKPLDLDRLLAVLDERIPESVHQ